MKSSDRVQKLAGSASFAAWALIGIVMGAVAGNRLDDAIRQVGSMTGATDPSWGSTSAAVLAANLIAAALASGIAFYVALKQAIPRFKNTFLNTVATATRQADGARPFKAVVLTLSRLEPDKLTQASSLADWIEREIAGGADGATLLDILCDKDPKRSGLANALSWQQTLRTVKFHAPRLRVLYFVLSPEAAAQFPVLSRILAPLVAKSVTIRPATHAEFQPDAASNLTNYTEVSRRIRTACEKAMELANCDHKDLCIDITSGQKIWSAAGTIVTLNSDAAFCYINTRADGDEGQMVVFNAEIVSGRSLT